MLLIVSNKTDLATDFLILRLQEREIPFLRLNTEEYLSRWEVDFFLGDQGIETFVNFGNESRISLNRISGAYIRQPKLPDLEVTKSDKEFSDREVGETLRSFWRFLSNDVWLNAPGNILRASNKPEQLNLARCLGFMIPETCISADRDVLRKFYSENNKDIIAKAVKHGFLYDGAQAKVAATQIFDEDCFKNFDNYVRIPMIFQERIEKVYDIRVTVIGDRVFSTAIESQERKETSVDWRLADHYGLALKHRAINLPVHLQKLCTEITKRLNLRYAALDLVLATNGKYYFLELNPNGQWAWIEQLVGHSIRDAIIDELTDYKLDPLQ